MMQKRIILCACSLLLGLCSLVAQTKLDADQTAAMLRTDTSVQLVDLRTPAELQQTGKITDAKHLNFKSPDFQAQIALLDKEKPLIIYCAAGGRSGKAAAQLVALGFKKVYDYTGGMNDWKQRGLKTVDVPKGR